MGQEHDWQYDLDEYIRQGEPDRSEKSAAWQTAIGLQDVDGLQTSDYLLETAKDHIEGKIEPFGVLEFDFHGGAVFVLFHIRKTVPHPGAPVFCREFLQDGAGHCLSAIGSAGHLAHYAYCIDALPAAQNHGSSHHGLLYYRIKRFLHHMRIMTAQDIGIKLLHLHGHKLETAFFKP